MNYNTTKHYSHLNAEKRFLIEKLFYKKYSIRQIANFLNVNHSTVSRELKRNSNFYGFYDHLIANEKAKIRHKHKRLFFFSQMDDYKEFSKLIKDNFNKATCGIKMTYNLIKERVKNIKIPSLRTVFNWINTGKWVLTNKDRLRKHYTKGGKRKNNVIERLVQSNYVFPIWARPKHIDLRETFGHWEGDLVIGKKSAGHSSLLTLVERKSRLGIIVKVSSKNPFYINKVLYERINTLELPVESITFDNGIEFNAVGILAKKLGIKIYKADKYASFQRGTNENFNGLIRRVYKKGTDFNKVSREEILNLEKRINFMNRDILEGKCAFDIYEEEIERLNKY